MVVLVREHGSRDQVGDWSVERGGEGALLAAELFALKTEPDAEELDKSLVRGLADVEEGRVRPIEEVKGLISQWT